MHIEGQIETKTEHHTRAAYFSLTFTLPLSVTYAYSLTPPLRLMTPALCSLTLNYLMDAHTHSIYAIECLLNHCTMTLSGRGSGGQMHSAYNTVQGSGECTIFGPI